MNSPISIINAYYPSLAIGEQKIADYILENMEKVSELNISDLSKDIGVSESSIFRFTKKLGFKGFREFKLACALNINQKTSSARYFEDVTVVEQNSLEYTLKSFMKTGIKNLEENLNHLDYSVLEEVVSKILSAAHVYLWGIGFSGHLAKGLEIRLRAIMNNLTVSNEYFRIIQDSYRVNADDIVIVLSFTGSPYVVENVLRAKESGAKIITFTGSYDNELYKNSDIQIVPGSYFKDYKSRYIGNELILKVILDSLYVYIENETAKEVNGKQKQFLHHFPTGGDGTSGK